MTEVPKGIEFFSIPLDGHHLLAYYTNMTEKRRKLLQYINCYRSENSSSPTIREMAVGAALADSKSVFRMVESLIEDGYLEKQKRKARSLRLTDHALSHLGTTALMVRYPIAQPLTAVVLSGPSVGYGQSLIDTGTTSVIGNII